MANKAVSQRSYSCCQFHEGIKLCTRLQNDVKEMRAGKTASHSGLGRSCYHEKTMLSHEMLASLKKFPKTEASWFLNNILD